MLEVVVVVVVWKKGREESGKRKDNDHALRLTPYLPKKPRGTPQRFKTLILPNFAVNKYQ